MNDHPLSTPAKNTESVRFEHVGLRYGRGEEILNDISFTLRQGSMNFVTGPSGSGKTSLLKLIYLSMRPSRGLITLFEKDISQLDTKSIPALKRRMGIVLQDFGLIDDLTIFENTALPLRVAGIERDQYVDNVVSLLKWVGLGDRMLAFPRTLSAGEQQRAAIARAVISKPEILIADEPTGNVDNEIAKRLIRLFSELNRLGTTLIVATHDTALIPKGANIMSLRNGILTSNQTGMENG